MTIAARRQVRRGGPLVMLLLLLTGWSTARAVWWESPFVPLGEMLELPQSVLAEASGRAAGAGGALPSAAAPAQATLGLQLPVPMQMSLPLVAPGWRARRDARLAAAHQLLLFAALRDPLLRAPSASGMTAALPDGVGRAGEGVAPPFLPRPVPASAAPAGRWSLDAWAFWRQGSNAAPVSQGRVPIYGASQVGGVLQYRIAPGSGRDPRAYVRAYRAMVRQGENEVALGASLRPLPSIPLRAAGEVRFTDAAFGNQWRPAAYFVSELTPVALPYGAQLEAYGQAGWVGGAQPTAFADGQASVTAEVPQIARLTDDAARLSLGAAAWGGAQKDAQRIDIGPTLRLDVTMGDMPARVSIDWRQQVAGDASPRSGVAVTLATGF